MHRFENTILTLTAKGLEKPEAGAFALRDVSTGETIPLQAEAGWWSRTAWLRFILPVIEAGQVREFELVETPSPDKRCVLRESDEAIDVVVDSELVTRYHFGQKWVRPFLWPLIGAGGVPVTRPWPMQEAEGEEQDHEHHKSVWTALGDLNGVDIWSEHGDHGSVVHDCFAERSSGPVFCRFSTKEDWLNANGERVMRSYCDFTFYALPSDQKVIDFTMCFRAPEAPVRFADTKEGGILSVRVRTSMNGSRGGMIENAYGGRTERECWGKPAPWVDYSGPVDGTHQGIAIFDHPDNPHHPTRWHVRDYGLFTANPWALHDYLGTDEVDGGETLECGKVWKYQYRMYLHPGDAAGGGVRDKYLAYAAVPEVREVTEA